MNNFQQFNLDSNICKAITYPDPTPVQSRSIPEVMEGNDVVVSAQTGTGKTAAFVLPILHFLSLQDTSKKTRVLILTPTRELAAQITKAAALYGKYMRFNIVSLVGGMPYHHQIKDLARGADIIVATPGRLMDHIEQKRVDLSNIEILVLDEADRMLDMGFIDDVQYIAKLTPAERQTLLFSATLDNKLMNAVKHLLKQPVRIDLSHERIASPQIQEEMYKVSNLHHKTRLLKHFLGDENIYKAIIFSATKSHADKLASELRDDGFKAAALHGDLRQNVRNRTLEQLRRGKIQYLVATDVAARGIDISDITHVFNYDLPRFCEDYVHRIGRTGRAGKTGVAISFVAASDMHHLRSIERYTGQRVKLQHHDVREEQRSTERPERFVERAERFERSERSERFHDRDEKPFRSEKRSGKKYGSDKKEWSERKPRADRAEREDRFDRSDRQNRFEKSDRPFRKKSFKKDGERFEKKFRGERQDRSERFERNERSDRSERFGRGEKSERRERSGRSERSDRNERFEKNDRPFKKRSIRFDDKPQSERMDRSERKFHSGKNRETVKVEFREGGYRPKSKMSFDKKPRRNFDESRRQGESFGHKKKKRRRDD